MRNFSKPNTTYIPVCIATKLTRRSHPGNEVALFQCATLTGSQFDM